MYWTWLNPDMISRGATETATINTVISRRSER